MKVSVVIANWNYDRYLETAITSVRSQNYLNVELILVDDGSTDSSPEIMRRYDGQAKLLFKPNGGQASALNFAFPHCTGEMVIFLDADDLLSPGALARLVSIWRPQFSKVHFPMEVVDEQGRLLGAQVPRARLPEGDLKDEAIARGMYVSPPCSGNAYSRPYLDAVMPIPEGEWTYADAYLIAQAPLYGTIGAVREPLAHYRRHSRSATNVSASGTVELKQKLNTMLRTETSVTRLIRASADRLGLAASAHTTGGDHWLQLKTRLALAKLDRAPAIEVGKLAANLLKQVWNAAELSARGKAEFAAFAIVVAFAPLPLAEPVIRMAFAPGDRGRIATIWETRREQP